MQDFVCRNLIPRNLDNESGFVHYGGVYAC